MTAATARSVADLLQAFNRLRPQDEEARQALAKSVGFSLPATQSALPEADFIPIKPGATPTAGGAPASPESLPTATSPPPQNQPIEAPQAPDKEELAATLTLIATSRPEPAWLAAVEPLPADVLSPTSRPTPEPLLTPCWTRAILIDTMATLASDGPLDLERITHHVGSAKPIRRLPRRTRPSLARGVQLLVDRSERLLPFRADQLYFIGQARAVAGRESVQVLQFDGLPTWGAGSGSRRTWRPYFNHHLPRRGTTVVVLSDLGLAPLLPGSRAATSADWTLFAAALLYLGSPLVAFVPYGPARWPAELRANLQLVHWDLTTTVRSARQTTGRSCRATTEALR